MVMSRLVITLLNVKKTNTWISKQPGVLRIIKHKQAIFEGMLGTFPQAFFQADTSKGYFLQKA